MVLGRNKAKRDKNFFAVEFFQTGSTLSEGKLLDKGAEDKRLNAVTELRQK